MKAFIITLKNRGGEDKPARLSRVSEIIKTGGKADLYMLPELWSVGFFSYEKYAAAAEPIDGPIISALSDLAREKNAYIFTGSIIEKRGGKLFNTAVLLDRNGNIAGHYSKTHLFSDEKKYLSPGNEYAVCDTEFGRAGISVCYDLRFPEQYRAMTDMGAEIFLNCSAWPSSRAEHWKIFNRARAVENQAAWLSCCSGGSDNGTRFAGISYAIAADGRVVLETENETAAAELDIGFTKKYRDEFPALRDRI